MSPGPVSTYETVLSLIPHSATPCDNLDSQQQSAQSLQAASPDALLSRYSCSHSLMSRLDFLAILYSNMNTACSPPHACPEHLRSEHSATMATIGSYSDDENHAGWLLRLVVEVTAQMLPRHVDSFAFVLQSCDIVTKSSRVEPLHASLLLSEKELCHEQPHVHHSDTWAMNERENLYWARPYSSAVQHHNSGCALHA